MNKDELDRRIAELRGWTWSETFDLWRYWICHMPDGETFTGRLTPYISENDWQPTRNGDQALALLAEMPHPDLLREEMGRRDYGCTHNIFGEDYEWADSPHEAICLAWIAWKEVPNSAAS